MRFLKLAFFLACFCSLTAAQTTTTFTGTIKDLANTVVSSGNVTFTLQPGADTTISGSARFTPQTVTCGINGSGLVKANDLVNPCVVTNNTALQPAGTSYKVQICPAFACTSSLVTYALGGSVDITTLVPTPAQTPAYSLVDLFANQSIGGNKSFTGASSFATATFSGLVTETAGVANTGGPGALGTAQICTTCWGNTPSLSIRRQDNSPPIGGVDIGTAFLDPIMEIRSMPSTVGSFVGSQTPLALVIANVSNKDYFTLTQSVTASGSPQTVSVSDSSTISTVPDSNGFLNNLVSIGFGKGTAETVTVTAIPDSTHITAIFSQNHASGDNAHGTYNTGFHLGAMIVAGENAGNKTDILGMNINITCLATADPGACNGIEMDHVLSAQRAALYSGEDSTHQLIWGFYHAMTGGVSGGVTDSFLSYSLDGISTANNGFMCAGCAKNFGFVVTANNGATNTASVGFSSQRATLAGFQVGSDQTAAENPSWTPTDPVDGFLALSQGNGSFTQSNFLTFNSYASSVKHTMSEVMHYNAGGLFFLTDTHTIDSNNFTTVGSDGYFNTSNSGTARGYRLRSSNLIISSYENVNGAATLAPRNSGTLAITGNSFTFPEGAAATASGNNDVCYGDSGIHRALCSVNNGPFLPLQLEATTAGNTKRLNADLTLAANTSLQTVFTWTLPAAANSFNLHCGLNYSQATAAVADAFGIQGATTAPTNLTASGIVYTAAGTSTSGSSGNITTTTATNVVTFTPSATATVFTATLDGQIEVGASGSTLNVMASQSVAADLLTIQRGSYCTVFQR